MAGIELRAIFYGGAKTRLLANPLPAKDHVCFRDCSKAGDCTTDLMAPVKVTGVRFVGHPPSPLTCQFCKRSAKKIWFMGGNSPATEADQLIKSLSTWL